MGRTSKRESGSRSCSWILTELSRACWASLCALVRAACKRTFSSSARLSGTQSYNRTEPLAQSTNGK
jgi:hypothetical protein